jgi:hypothetical protein
VTCALLVASTEQLFELQFVGHREVTPMKAMQTYAQKETHRSWQSYGVIGSYSICRGTQLKWLLLTADSHSHKYNGMTSVCLTWPGGDMTSQGHEIISRDSYYIRNIRLNAYE